MRAKILRWRSRIRSIVARHKVQFVVIDYLQLVTGKAADTRAEGLHQLSIGAARAQPLRLTQSDAALDDPPPPPAIAAAT